jgi:hypothetical protein
MDFPEISDHHEDGIQVDHVPVDFNPSFHGDGNAFGGMDHNTSNPMGQNYNWGEGLPTNQTNYSNFNMEFVRKFCLII